MQNNFFCYCNVEFEIEAKAREGEGGGKKARIYLLFLRYFFSSYLIHELTWKILAALRALVFPLNESINATCVVALSSGKLDSIS